MPGKNVIKTYVENGYYHIYNRGVEKRIIFQDELDYLTFLGYLKLYLSPPSPISNIFIPLNQPKLHEEVNLLSYCLMPNHYHLLLHQITKNGIEKLLRRIATKYVMYFNKRNQRVGPLFQSIFKAVRVETDNQLLHLSRYIHLNPIKDVPFKGNILIKAYSSYKNYLGLANQGWVHPKEILSFFATARKTTLKDTHSYQSFVENYKADPQEGVEGLTLDPIED